MKRILSLALAILMLTTVLTFTGCAKESAALVGTWTGEVNYASQFNQKLAVTAGTELAKYWQVEEFNLTIIMTFRKDGTYSMTVDKEKLNTSLEQLKQELHAGMTKYMEDLIAASESEMTVDELLGQLGISIEGMLDDALSDEVIDGLIAECSYEGKFDAKKGNLYTSAGPEFNIDKNVYETYEISGDTLTLLSIVSNYNGPRLDASLYPIVLKRTN